VKKLPTDKYPVPKEVSIPNLEECFIYSPTITVEQAKEVVKDVLRIRKMRAALEIYKENEFSRQFLYEMLK